MSRPILWRAGRKALNRVANNHMVQREHMPATMAETGQTDAEKGRSAPRILIERGILRRAHEFIPAGSGKVFVVTTEDVWRLHGADRLNLGNVLFLRGGEPQKRLRSVEDLAEQMVAAGADRSSIVVGFGGGIVTDVSGFLAAIFMRGIPVLQIPTTLLAQVDAAIGGKTGVNLTSGKNLIGSFHQPVAVLIDPDVLSTLPEREYRAGLSEVIKCGIIRDRDLFALLENSADEVLALTPEIVDRMIAGAVRVKTDVVSQDERELDLRRILNFGHTVGHALEAETEYVRFLHGEAVAWGMLAATRLAELLHMLDSKDAQRIRRVIGRYGPLPCAKDLNPDRLVRRLASDKKTRQGAAHFVLPIEIGSVKVISGIDQATIRQAIVDSLQAET